MDEQRIPFADVDAGWHVKKEIQIGHIITTITSVVVIVVYLGGIKQDVEVLKAQSVMQRERDDRQDSNLGATIAQMRVQLEKMDSKLDRIIEKGRK